MLPVVMHGVPPGWVWVVMSAGAIVRQVEPERPRTPVGARNHLKEQTYLPTPTTRSDQQAAEAQERQRAGLGDGEGGDGERWASVVCIKTEVL